MRRLVVALVNAAAFLPAKLLAAWDAADTKLADTYAAWGDGDE